MSGVRLSCFAFCLFPGCSTVSAQPQPAEPVKTALCEIFKNPEKFDGKKIQVHASVDSGVLDMPAGLSDDSCGAELKFYMPVDPDFGKLVKSKGFQKLLKDVKKNPAVEATVTGIFKRSVPGEKGAGLSLEAVEDVVVHPQPRVRNQKR